MNWRLTASSGSAPTNPSVLSGSVTRLVPTRLAAIHWASGRTIQRAPLHHITAQLAYQEPEILIYPRAPQITPKKQKWQFVLAIGNYQTDALSRRQHVAHWRLRGSFPPPARQPHSPPRARRAPLKTRCIALVSVIRMQAGWRAFTRWFVCRPAFTRTPPPGCPLFHTRTPHQRPSHPRPHPTRNLNLSSFSLAVALTHPASDAPSNGRFPFLLPPPAATDLPPPRPYNPFLPDLSLHPSRLPSCAYCPSSSQSASCISIFLLDFFLFTGFFSLFYFSSFFQPSVQSWLQVSGRPLLTSSWLISSIFCSRSKSFVLGPINWFVSMFGCNLLGLVSF